MSHRLWRCVASSRRACASAWSGLSVVGATVASTLTYLEPLVAVTVGVVVWNESLAPSSLLGALLIAGAGLYVVRASRTTSPPSSARVD